MNKAEEYVREKLFQMQDTAYRDFNSKLIPNVDKELVIGVRVPQLRAFAKEFSKHELCAEFISTLPHEYLEEYSLHAFIVCQIKDYEQTIAQLDKLLGFVDNWAVCDTISPCSFKKNKDKLIDDVNRWLSSDKTYTVRFAIGCLMKYFLGDDFKEEYAEAVCKIQSEEYYINMMIAWYFATALCKNYDSAVKYLENGRLSPWVNNKTISKACDSYRIDSETKKYLRSLRIKE